MRLTKWNVKRSGGFMTVLGTNEAGDAAKITNVTLIRQAMPPSRDYVIAEAGDDAHVLLLD